MVVRDRREQKGGDLSPAKLGAKPTDHDVESGWLVTELGGDLRDGAILDEEGAERFIPAMEGQLGLNEEAMVRLCIHEVGSHQETVFCPPRVPS